MTKNKKTNVPDIYSGWGTQSITAIAVNSEFIFTGYGNGKVAKWNKESGNLIEIWKDCSAGIKDLKLSKDGTKLFILFVRKPCIYVHPNLTKELKKVRLFQFSIAKAIALNDTHLFVACSDFIQGFDIVSHKDKFFKLVTMEEHRLPMTALAVGEKIMVSGGGLGDLAIWYIKNEFHRPCASEAYDISSIVIAEDEKTFFVADIDGGVNQNGIDGDTIDILYEGNNCPITQLTIHQGKLFGLDQDENTTQLLQWDADGKNTIINTPRAWQGFAMTSDGKILFIAAGNKIIRKL